MLADKSGLRDKKSLKKNTISNREIEKQKQDIKNRDLNSLLSGFGMLQNSKTDAKK